jgi:glycosyltransferase involved in cell wall biosynthesis
VGARSVRVNVVCRNWRDDRVLPRFARYLADGLGWTLTERPLAPAAVDAYYLNGYFECQMFERWPPARPVASLFTHREEADPSKAALYDRIAGEAQLRVSMCRLYGDRLRMLGPTIQPPLPVERDRFTIVEHAGGRRRPLAGLAGYSYRTGRKGEGLASWIVHGTSYLVDWIASGRGWPAPMKRRSWAEMPAFYQQLDVLVCPSTVEGGPMPVLEALACGVPVVVPRGVGILDELPIVAGIYRYPRGDAAGLLAALDLAAFPEAPVDREALRRVTEPFTVEAWCRAHAEGLARAFGGAA